MDTSKPERELDYAQILFRHLDRMSSLVAGMHRSPQTTFYAQRDFENSVDQLETLAWPFLDQEYFGQLRQLNEKPIRGDELARTREKFRLLMNYLVKKGLIRTTQEEAIEDAEE